MKESTLIVPLGTFENEMTSRSLEYAYDYVDERRIHLLEEVSAGLFHAEVDGAERYDVDIRLRDDGIVFASCTCPYDYDGYCKHVGAVLLKLRDCGGQGKAVHAGPAKRVTTRCERVFDRVQGHMRKVLGLAEGDAWSRGRRVYLVWDQTEISAIVQANPDFASTNDALMPDETMKRVMEAPIRRHLDGDYGWRFEWGDSALNGVMDVFEEAERSTDYPRAVAHMCAALRKTWWFGRQIDDDEDGVLQEYVDRLCDRLLAYCYVVAPRVSIEQEKRMLDEIGMLIDDIPMDEMSYWKAPPLACVIPFADIHGRGLPRGDTAGDAPRRHDDAAEGHAAEAARFLDGMEKRVVPHRGPHEGVVASSDTWNGFRELVAKVRYDYLLYRGEGKQADSLLHDNIDAPVCRSILFAYMFLDERYADLAALIEKTITDDKVRENAARWRFAVDLPHGELTVLEACYERMGDREGIGRLYERYVAYGDSPSDERYIPLLKAMVGDGCWPQCVRNILGCYHDADFGGRALARLISEEGLSDEAVHLVTLRPDLLPELLYVIGIDHEELAETYVRERLPLTHDLRQGNRTEYRGIAVWIERYRHVFGLHRAEKLAKEVMAKYPRRYALREEIERALR
ncbi:SWIM zinc finger family protein [Bifidobacterium stellenboschense]|uniref:SWIM zinc finger family protein n=1 Tax=Bifidobacterium stellenboschense TaxID=762211 RepID=UPI001EE7592A|nr:SWIM zinc finger family protein [Bifidobacterium stellenboschense]